MDILAFAWLGIIAFGVILYVILDGFGLGMGLISPLFKEHDKDIIVSTILPVWDGNETWLVFVGATLYGAFPLAFSTILPAFYMPILIMVVALLFRGASFEFRLKTHTTKGKRSWNMSFFFGSLFATIAQALILAGLLTGFSTPNEYASFTFYQWFNPFGLFCAVALINGYALLGSNRLIIKTSGQIQQQCYKLSKILQVISLLCVLVIVYWTQKANPDIAEIWFNSPRSIYFLALIIIGTIIFIAHVITLHKKYESAPYWLLIALFLLAYVGLLLSIYPYIIPHHLTYIEAKASNSSLLFMLIGAIIMLPILLYYTYYSYKIFRGKTHEKIEY